MAKDPATLWYWNDWHSGTVTFSRHLKGCYMDLLHAQFNNGRLSLDAIKTVLGNDFASWGALSKKFKVDEQGLYYNERAESEQLKRAKFSESRRKNASSKKPEHMQQRMEDEDENINTHSVFSLRLLSNEYELDKEAIEVSTRTIITEELLNQFNANLQTSEVKHNHFSEYKKHLRNWITTKPTHKNTYGKQTRKGHDIEGVVSAADKILSEYSNSHDSGGGEQSDTDISDTQKRA